MRETEFIDTVIEPNRAAADEKNIEFELEIGPLTIPTDSPSRLLNCLQRLVSHAIDWTPADGRISLLAIETPWGWELEIADSSDQTADVARRSFVIVQAAQELSTMGCQLQLLNCSQGGIAYTVMVPRRARAAA